MLYTHLPLDRAHTLRKDEAIVTALAAHPDHLVVPCWREMSLTRGDHAYLAEKTEAARLLDLGDEPIFLGLLGERPVFATDLTQVEAEPDQSPPGLGTDGTWVSLRTVGGTLAAGDAALLAYARALVQWHRRAKFCGTCGSPTRQTEGGHARQCTDPHCNALTYPRTDAAVIMRVDGTDENGDDAILMHRQSAWAPGMWSVLAGFVEPGESLEEAVAREIKEESGIEVADVRYFAAQPWPFPSSLMIGFSAKATGGRLAPDASEIEDAQWFSRARIAAEFDDRHRTDGSGRPFLPRPDAIARHLVDAWLSKK